MTVRWVGVRWIGVCCAVTLVLGVLGACGVTPAGSEGQGYPAITPQRVCLETAVHSGRHPIAAFALASRKALTRQAQGQGLEVTASCAVGDLRVRYSMRFDAQNQRWSARLETQQGVMSRQLVDSGPFHPHGAFQYLTESTAETLFVRLVQGWNE